MSAYPAEKLPYSWQEYQKLPEGERWEIIDGEAYSMSPTPSTRHQRILLDLACQLKPQFSGRPSELIIAPLDVKFDDLNCTEPDLMIVCDPKQIRKNHIEGAPAVVVEIVSEYGSVRDRVKKMKLYARFGVKEYWIVTQWQPMIEVFHLDGETYRVAGSFGKEDAFRSPGFPDLKLDLAALFDYPPEPGEALEVVKEPPARYGQPAVAR